MSKVDFQSKVLQYIFSSNVLLHSELCQMKEIKWLHQIKAHDVIHI